MKEPLRPAEKSLFKVLMRQLVALSLLGLLTACTVSSSQWSALQNAFRTPEDELAPYRWQVTSGSFQAQLVAVTLTDGVTLFANQDEDMIIFDGWMITEMAGLGLTAEKWVIEGATGERRFSAGKWLMNKHYCEAWRLLDDKERGVQVQDCADDNQIPYQNRINLDVEGRIIRIEQNIGLKQGGLKNTLVLEKR